MLIKHAYSSSRYSSFLTKATKKRKRNIELTIIDYFLFPCVIEIQVNFKRIRNRVPIKQQGTFWYNSIRCSTIGNCEGLLRGRN